MPKQSIVAKARVWIDDLASGRVRSFTEIAMREGKVQRHIRLLAPLAFLPPYTLTAIANGTLSQDVTVTTLARDVPYSWRQGLFPSALRGGASCLRPPRNIPSKPASQPLGSGRSASWLWTNTKSLVLPRKSAGIGKTTTVVTKDRSEGSAEPAKANKPHQSEGTGTRLRRAESALICIGKFPLAEGRRIAITRPLRVWWNW
jgi:hypothetical protein